MTKNVGSVGASEGSLFLGSVQRGIGARSLTVCGITQQLRKLLPRAELILAIGPQEGALSPGAQTHFVQCDCVLDGTEELPMGWGKRAREDRCLVPEE